MSTRKYVKKPIEVEAFQLTQDMCRGTEYIPFKKVEILEGFSKVAIGSLYANVGDYIIKGIEGEVYPCSESVFNKTYREVADVKLEELEKLLEGIAHIDEQYEMMINSEEFKSNTEDIQALYWHLLDFIRITQVMGAKLVKNKLSIDLTFKQKPK